MSSELECNCGPDVVARFNAACAEIRERVSGRQSKAEAITRRARRFGIDVTADAVLRHFDWFERWDNGLIATGYLIRRTGVKRIPRA